MASVTQPRDRGQLILVAGLTVAVILVMLVLLLNTVIYTENLATRGIDSGAGDAVEYRATVVGSVAELIERENERYDEGYPPSEGVATGVKVIDRTLSERHLERGVIAETHVNGVLVDESSSRIWQNESGTLTANGGESDWTVATNITAFERFTMIVVPDQFAENQSPFRVQIGDWTMEIDVIEVEVDGAIEERIEVTIDPEEEGVSTYQYDYGEAPLEIGLVEGSIETDGGSTDVIAPPAPNENGLRYENGNEITGTFELHTTGTPSESTLTEYDGDSGEGPYYTYPVESVDLTIRYETSELRFVTEETVRAEEP